MPKPHARRLSLLAAVFFALALLPAVPVVAADSVTYEVHYVETVDDAVVRVEIMRDTAFDASRQPVILTYSPYNSLGEPDPANDSIARRYVPQGYARAVADVLGTRGSTGCWDYGGPKEQQSGVDVVKYLARQPWSSGKVGMIGGSYNGTTANMVAARGPDVPELKAIVPIAAISHWYGYAYGNGARYFLNSERVTDEGFDTPLAFDFGFGDTVAADPDGQYFSDTIRARVAECGAVEHTEEAYNRTPDYDQFWLERDYRKDAEKFRAAVLVVHGWQDYNVKQQEGTSLYEALPVDDPGTTAVEGVPFKRLYMTQERHSGGSGPLYQPLVDDFFAQTLKGIDTGVDDGAPVLTLGRTFDGPQAEYRSESSYPPAETDETALWLRRTFDPEETDGVTLPPPGDGQTGVLSTKPNHTTHDNVFSYLDTGTSTEELNRRQPITELSDGYSSLFYASLPLAADTRMVGSAILDAVVRNQVAAQHLTPVLLDIAPDGSAKTVERGFLNLDYRNGLAKAQPSAGEWVDAEVELLPQDYTFKAGHRIGLLVQSSNTVWAVPGALGTVDVANGRISDVTPIGSRLQLPLVGAGNKLFVKP